MTYYHDLMEFKVHKEYNYPGKVDIRVLPTTAHEVSCVLIYSIKSPGSENVCLGQIDENVEDTPPIFVSIPPFDTLTCSRMLMLTQYRCAWGPK